MKSLQHFILESNYSLESKIKEIYGDYLEALDLYENRDNIQIARIIIKEELRKQGYFKKIMNYIIDYANKNNLILHLTPDSSLGTNINTLKSIYMSLGFTFNKGVNKDFRFMSTMIKNPE